MSRSLSTFAVCGVLAAFSAGCGNSVKLYPASGSVKFEGKPVDGATVTFIPQQGSPISATTDSSGNFTISTRGMPGAPADTYSVTIIKQPDASSTPAMPAMPSAEGGPPSGEEILKMQKEMTKQMQERETARKSGASKPLLPAKYAVPQGNDLHAKVTEDAAQNVFNFDLTP